MDLREAVGLAVRDARMRLGWSQDDLAAASDTDRAYIGSLENGRRNPAILTLERVADALSEDMGSLFTAAERHRGGSQRTPSRIRRAKAR